MRRGCIQWAFASAACGMEWAAGCRQRCGGSRVCGSRGLPRAALLLKDGDKVRDVGPRPLGQGFTCVRIPVDGRARRGGHDRGLCPGFRSGGGGWRAA